MAKPHLRDPQRERFWRTTVQSWQASGQSIRSFCRQHRLAETAFHFWRKELRRRQAEGQPAFVPVTVLPAPTATLEVRCPSGHIVVLSGCEESTLKALFAALDQEAAC